MFALGGNRIPQSQAEFEAALSEGLAVLGNCPGIVGIDAPAYPALGQLSLDLSGARIPSSLRPSRATGETTPGVRIQSFTVHADPLKLPEATATLSIEATGVALDFDRSESGTPMLVLTDADHGNIDLRIARSDLGSMIDALARKAAEKQDVEVEGTEVDFTSESPRALRFRATVNARKMIFSVEVIVTGRFEIDESLDARLMDLDCSGKGMIGTAACEMIRPHLARIEGRTFPLAALPMGNVRLRDLQLHVGDPLQIEAVFGSR